MASSKIGRIPAARRRRISWSFFQSGAALAVNLKRKAQGELVVDAKIILPTAKQNGFDPL
jgi:hypothetical protein